MPIPATLRCVLAHAIEHPDRGPAWVFETGRAVEFHALRNTVSAPKAIRGVDLYQQALEPAGRFMVSDPLWGHNATRQPTPGWVLIVQRFDHPLVLVWNTGAGGYDDQSWKAHLHRAYRAKGRALSTKLRRDGFDGIVTVRGAETSEIVALP